MAILNVLFASKEHTAKNWLIDSSKSKEKKKCLWKTCTVKKKEKKSTVAHLNSLQNVLGAISQITYLIKGIEG